ncbi:integrase family protein [Caballeronia arvi]|uniref:Integrase family protein n=1 Tax=Caballeronia arvi TaxID=1777135 RepID=A0A158L1U1_9BURK|nr:integrase family protein [Caballeronia arvi]
MKPALPPSIPVALQPTPLERLVIPSEMDGSVGLNRAFTGRGQIAAENDLDAIRAWLSRFVDTKTTFENYRKEAERLVLWSVVMLGKPLSSLTHEDCLRYQRFLADPRITYGGSTSRLAPRAR